MRHETSGAVGDRVILLSAIERGERLPSLNLLYKICTLLQGSLNDLVEIPEESNELFEAPRASLLENVNNLAEATDRVKKLCGQHARGFDYQENKGCQRGKTYASFNLDLSVIAVILALAHGQQSAPLPTR